MPIRLKRVYDPPAATDGVRVLVERLWPRGLTKEAAAVDHWMKDVSPSPELRQWYAHDPEKWPAFQRRYLAELEANESAVEAIEALCAKAPVTFVFAAKDEVRNSAALLKSHIERRARRRAN